MQVFPEQNRTINLRNTLVDLASYRMAERTKNDIDPLVVHIAYAQENLVYRNGRIVKVDEAEYRQYKKSQPNDLVNKFGRIYAGIIPLFLHKKLADVLIDAALDMHARYKQFTVVMDGLRTYEAGFHMQQNRPDLVRLGLLAKAGTSAHNRALAVDSKLFEAQDGKFSLFELVESDEKGHLDDIDMVANSRFYAGPISDAARTNRINRIQAWQRASVKNRLPIANLLAEFWDDRVPGSPADMWRVLSCRALCIGADGNPKTNPLIQTLKDKLNTLHDQNSKQVLTRQQFAESAHTLFASAWNQVFTSAQKKQLEEILGKGGGEPPALSDFIFHEWLQTIHDSDLLKADFPAQAIASAA